MTQKPKKYPNRLIIFRAIYVERSLRDTFNARKGDRTATEFLSELLKK